MSVPIFPDPSVAESDAPDRHGPPRGPDVPEATSTDQTGESRGRREQKILFLDDDARRAEIFLKGNPEAIWIQTAGECVARLAETWEEVYLDHDLGGEHYVDVERPDCGMEVVRWLCKEPRSHLNSTRFIIHSHNLAAAMMMVLLMRETGYNAEFLPFGFNLEIDPFSPPKEIRTSSSSSGRGTHPFYRRWFRWLAGLFGRGEKSDR